MKISKDQLNQRSAAKKNPYIFEHIRFLLSHSKTVERNIELYF